MKKKQLLLLIFMLILNFNNIAIGQDDELEVYSAPRLADDQTIDINGSIDEDAWGIANSVPLLWRIDEPVNLNDWINDYFPAHPKSPEHDYHDPADFDDPGCLSGALCLRGDDLAEDRRTDIGTRRTLVARRRT